LPCSSPHFRRKDIVDVDKLKHPETRPELFPLAKGLGPFECPVSLIGDDINSVAKQSSAELDIPIILQL
jgi:nitrogenase molybdenum-iron protein alpha chain